MKPDDAVRNISMIRIAVGAGAWLAPKLTGKAFLLDLDANPQAPYLARLFGARDVALGYGNMTSSGSARTKWLMAGLACDVADALAAYAGGRSGSLSRLQTVILTVPALTGIGMGVVTRKGDGGAPPAGAGA
jgi:hypothetical protein